MGGVTGEQRLKHIAHVAAHTYGLTVWQWLPGPVGGHSSTSYHFRVFPDGTGKAFDVYGPRWRMARFLRWLRRSGQHAHLSEGIFNGRVYKLSVLHGAHVPSSLWGETTWRNHRNHIHIARDINP